MGGGVEEGEETGNLWFKFIVNVRHGACFYDPGEEDRFHISIPM
jgi:hypothetical protein